MVSLALATALSAHPGHRGHHGRYPGIPPLGNGFYPGYHPIYGYATDPFGRIYVPGPYPVIPFGPTQSLAERFRRARAKGDAARDRGDWKKAVAQYVDALARSRLAFDPGDPRIQGTQAALAHARDVLHGRVPEDTPWPEDPVPPSAVRGGPGRVVEVEVEREVDQVEAEGDPADPERVVEAVVEAATSSPGAAGLSSLQRRTRALEVQRGLRRGDAAASRGDRAGALAAYAQALQRAVQDLGAGSPEATEAAERIARLQGE